MSASKIVMRIVSISFSVMVFILIVYGLYQLGLKSYSYGYRVFAEPAVTSGSGRERIVRVQSSMGITDVADLLLDKGLVRDKWLFVVQMKLSQGDRELVAGDYIFNTSMTPKEMIEELYTGGEDEEEEDAA